MASATTYIFGSVFAVSAVSLIGVILFALNESTLQKLIVYLVSFAAGALFGNAFIHLLPHTAEGHGFTPMTGITVLSGIVVLFAVENYIHWHHHHTHMGQTQVQPFSYMILLGDSVHNIIDGLIIAASYLASIPLGIATTTAVALHEIPQELGDFAIMVHGGFSTWKAVAYNFVSALTAFIGAIIALILAGSVDELNSILLPFAAGAFIYIAGSDLLPEIKGEEDRTRLTVIMGTFLTGILLMYLLTLLETAA